MSYLAVAAQAVSIPILSFLSVCCHNIYLHLPRSYPGPKLWTASNIPASFHNLCGRLPYAIKEFHDIYGDAVRIGPSHLSHISSDAWDDIYGHIRGRKTKSFQKDVQQRPGTGTGVPNMQFFPQETGRVADNLVASTATMPIIDGCVNFSRTPSPRRPSPLKSTSSRNTLANS